MAFDFPGIGHFFSTLLHGGEAAAADKSGKTVATEAALSAK